MIHPEASIHPTAKVYEYTTIEARVFIGAGSVIGGRCFIGAGALIGHGVHIQDGCFIPRGTVIENNVFIGPGVRMADDRLPTAGMGGSYKSEPPRLRAGCSIGMGALIAPGVEIGEGARVRMGALVLKSVPAADYYRREEAA